MRQPCDSNFVAGRRGRTSQRQGGRANVGCGLDRAGVGRRRVDRYAGAAIDSRAGDVPAGELRVGDVERARGRLRMRRSEEHTSELQSPDHLVCRLLLEKKKKTSTI